MRIERHLGALEKYQVSKQLTHCYGSVTSTAVFRHSSRHDQDVKQFYLRHLHAPLALLVKKHPQLSLVVAENNKSSVHFLRLESFNLEAIIEIKEFAFWDQAELAQVIGKECDREFDLNDHTIPLWHLTIGVHKDRPDECSITIAAHHVIFDGKSLTQFWQDLELDYPSELDNFIIQSGETPLMGPYEERGAPMPTTMDLLPIVGKILAKKILPSSIFHYWFSEGWAGDVPSDKNQTHDTVVRIVQVDESVWSKVCAICRDNGVTPHAAIMAALVEAFADLYPNTMVKTTTPTNCRPVSPQVAQDEMGNFFGAYTYTWSKINTVKFWDRAKIYGQLLKANKTQAAKVAGQLTYFSKYPEDYCDFWYGHRENPMGRSGGIELSDLGRLVLNKSWQIQSLWFCQSAQIFTSPLSVNTISTQDSMYASIGWQKGSLDESKADALGPLLREILNNCIHEH